MIIFFHIKMSTKLLVWLMAIVMNTLAIRDVGIFFIRLYYIQKLLIIYISREHYK